MTPSEPFIALAPVATALESLGAGYYITGSIASTHHGVPRSTMDVDVVANIEPEHIDALVSSLGDEYYADPGAIRQAVERRGSFNLIHLPTMFNIDVFIQSPDPLSAALRVKTPPLMSVRRADLPGLSPSAFHLPPSAFHLHPFPL